MVPSVDGTKKEKMFPAFKVTDEMHDTVSRLAAKHHRKLMDQVRHLLELGARVEDRHAKLMEEAIQGEAEAQPSRAPDHFGRHIKPVKDSAVGSDRLKRGHSR